MSNFYSTLDAAITGPHTWVMCRTCDNYRKLAIKSKYQRYEAQKRPCRDCANRSRRQGKPA